LQNVTKIVAGSDTEALATISSVYSRVVQAGLCEVSSIQVAEAAKILENTQRDLNIALMNEMAMICHQLDINTQEVIDAAATKWNFLRFTPGLVGGHCIGIDPYYMTYKAKEIGYEPRVILSGRQINDSMGRYIAQQVIQQLVKMGKVITTAKVLVMGVTFKENISDTRNSKVIDIIKTLQTFNVQIDITDPHALPDLLEKEYQLTLTAELSNDYDAVIVAVPHQAYLKLTEEDLLKYAKENALLVDVKNIFKNKIQKMAYWSL
jgi:UDP-N-acetyl-D-galactosamine dehydrogenase